MSEEKETVKEWDDYIKSQPWVLPKLAPGIGREEKHYIKEDGLSGEVPWDQQFLYGTHIHYEEGEE